MKSGGLGGIMGESIVLSVGEDYHLKRGKDYVIYAGMLSDSLYSIVQRKRSGNQAFAWNLFF